MNIEPEYQETLDYLYKFIDYSLVRNLRYSPEKFDLGRMYDFVNIIEAKDNKAIAKISVELGSRGSVQFLTMPAIPIEEFIATLKK